MNLKLKVYALVYKPHAPDSDEEDVYGGEVFIRREDAEQAWEKAQLPDEAACEIKESYVAVSQVSDWEENRHPIAL